MKIKEQVRINASANDIWKIITDIKNSPTHISGIEKVEILEEPENGVVGLKWVETRTLFGKTATETMWITHAEENKYYQTRAESHGAIYISKMSVSEEGDQHVLTMEFSSKAVSFGAKIMGGIFGFMFKNATKKAVVKDLNDIKQHAEKTQ